MAKKAPAPRKPAAKKAPTAVNTVSDEQRYRMIAEAAYFRAESGQFKGDPVRDWIEAERDIAYDPEPSGRYNVAPGLKFCS